mgnify:CR=1 FL=1
MKKLFLLCCFFAVTLTINANGWIHFQTNYNNPNPIGIGRQRTPVQSPAVYLEDCTLSFNAFEDDCVIQLLDEDDAIVFSDIISAGTTSFLLPSTLEGEYQIQLIYGNFIFTGYIEL